MQRLYDPIRKCSVPDLPEERVRQHLISQMLDPLGYPLGLIAVEKDLKTFAHIQNSKEKFPAEKRRVDILCYGKDIHHKYPLYPLLMIECKAVELTQKTIDQVVGYNHYVKAHFFAIANEKEIKTFWYDHDQNIYQSVDFLPPYQQLVTAVEKFANVKG